MNASLHPYNLFRRKGPSDLLCAVPEDRAVPAFVSATAWEFTQKLENDNTLPSGFNRRAATMGVRFNGFYLYQTPAR